MFASIITDCRDNNARVRQEARVSALFPEVQHISFCGVESDVEAAGCLVDVLDARLGKPALILVNVAPRDGVAKKWANGSPFGWVRIGEIVIVATIQGRIFSLLDRFVDHSLGVQVFDAPRVVQQFNVDPETAERILSTQFRSFEFLPRAARALIDGVDVAAVSQTVSSCDDVIWGIDNFGNAKLTLSSDQVKAKKRKQAHVVLDDEVIPVAFYEQLRDVPDGHLALVAGSSGLGTDRFLELVVQGDSAAQRLGLYIGQTIFLLQ